MFTEGWKINTSKFVVPPFIPGAGDEGWDYAQCQEIGHGAIRAPSVFMDI